MEFLMYLLKSAAYLSLFYAVYFLFMRSDTLFKEKRQFLILGIFTAFLLPFAEFTRISYQEVPALPETAMSVGPLTTGDTTGLITNTPAFDLQFILTFIYGAGILLFALYYVWHLGSLLLMLKRNQGYKKGRYTYIKVKEDVAPFSFFNYVVFNPDHHDEAELAMILTHEESHAKQWHSLDILISHALVVLQWGNPLAWLYRKSIEENLEFLADRSAIGQLSSKKDYQLALVKASSATFKPALTNQFYQSFIKKRIVMLNKRKSKKTNLVKACLILPLLAVFFWSFNVTDKVVYKTVAIDPAEEEMIPAHEEMIDVPEQAVITESFEDVAPQTATATSKVIDRPEVVEEETPVENLSITQAVVTPMAQAFNYRNTLAAAKLVSASDQDGTIRITKNTTEADLAEYKRSLAEKDIEFNYSNLEYNDENQLTGIQIAISGPNGNNSNYHVNGEEPINDIFISMGENWVSMGSPESEYKRALQSVERSKARSAEMAKRNQEKSMELAKRSQERAKELQARSMERQKEMKERMKAREAEMKARYGELARAKEEYAGARIASGEGNTFVYDSRRSHGKSIRIHARTSDAELADMQRELALQDIEFKYKRLKRNSNGEITSIHIMVDDNKGSTTNTTVKSDDGEAIDEVVIHI